ncbi:MAG: molybdate ABC transporter substrate-binding protein [Bdellovibrionia bacterium]
MKSRLIAAVLIALQPFVALNVKAELRIAAAADLTFVMHELVKEFNKARKDSSIHVSYGASGNFHAQIIQHAPFDMFFSANEEYVTDLISRKLAEPKERFEYGEGRIALWVPKSSPIDLDQSGMEALLNSQIRKIAIANPRHAPYGKAAEAAMKSAGIYERIKRKLVFGEDISQATQFVHTKSADIGILALGLIKAPEIAEQGKFWIIPPHLYPKMVQEGVILKRVKDLNSAQNFRNYVLSQEGKRILEKYGFIQLKSKGSTEVSTSVSGN